MTNNTTADQISIDKCDHPRDAWDWNDDDITRIDTTELRISGTCTACGLPIEGVFCEQGVTRQDTGDWVIL